MLLSRSFDKFECIKTHSNGDVVINLKSTELKGESTKRLRYAAKRVLQPALEVVVAQSLADVVEAQKLRHRIFTHEYGARLSGNGIDHDVFDAYCDHLLVRVEQTGEVVGTYRVLPPAGPRSWVVGMRKPSLLLTALNTFVTALLRLVELVFIRITGEVQPLCFFGRVSQST